MTAKQRLFVQFYVPCRCNASAAARRAGYSETYAATRAFELKQNPEVARAIAEQLDTVTMPAEEVLLRLAEEGRASVGDFFDLEDRAALVEEIRDRQAREALALDSGTLSEPETRDARAEMRRLENLVWEIAHGGSRIVLNLEKARDADHLHLVKGIKWTADGRPVLEFHDAQAALVQIGRHHQLFVDRVDHTTSGKEIAGFNLIAPDTAGSGGDRAGSAGEPEIPSGPMDSVE